MTGASWRPTAASLWDAPVIGGVAYWPEVSARRYEGKFPNNLVVGLTDTWNGLVAT